MELTTMENGNADNRSPPFQRRGSKGDVSRSSSPGCDMNTTPTSSPRMAHRRASNCTMTPPDSPSTTHRRASVRTATPPYRRAGPYRRVSTESFDSNVTQRSTSSINSPVVGFRQNTPQRATQYIPNDSIEMSSIPVSTLFHI